MDVSSSAAPPAPPVKPQKFRHFPLTDSRSPSSCVVSPPAVVQCPDSELSSGRTERLHPSPADLRSYSPPEPDRDRQTSQNPPTSCGYVELLKTDGEAAGRKTLDRSSYHHAIAALESTSEEEEEEEEKARRGFLQPVLETESGFRPAEFESRLLPPENKPLEMAVLKRAKELLLSHDHQSIATHLLMADCQVHTPHTHTSHTPLTHTHLTPFTEQAAVEIKHLFTEVFQLEV